MNLNNNQENTNQRIYVGNSLARDPQNIQNLLEVSDVDGIVMHVSRVTGKSFDIYRPTTPLTTEDDVVKTVRKFLGFAAVFGGATLQTVKDPKEIPDNALDFEQLYQKLYLNTVLCND